jgi:two-component system response regulator HydG
LFLDEIGDMPLTMQAKLLRVLQDKQITRLGSNEPIQVDVRFIAATNKDLEAAVRDRTFREDLYFRIKGVTITLPPLRQRREDIPLLIQHLLERASKKLGRHIAGIDSDVKATLMAYSWPGNVRQLENVVENMVILAQGDRLTMADIPPDIAPAMRASLGSTSTALVHIGANAASTAITSLGGVNLADLEKQAIEKTLEMVQGNREQAAKILGIGERTLYRKIKDYGLQE